MEIQDAARRLDRAALIRLLERLYGIHPEVDELIDAQLELAAALSVGTAEVVAKLRLRIQRLAREDDFIDYRESHGLARRLEELLLDIDSLLRERDPAAALELTEQFLCLANPLMGRVDDSDGEVGQILRDAAEHWLALAAEVRAQRPDQRNWTARLLDYFNQDDYGCFHTLLARSRQLLSDAELRQLADRFEADARQALATQPEDDGYNVAASQACIGLQGVAEALEDMALYERSTLITSPEPNALQMAQLVEFALSIGQYARAEHWLAQPGWDHPHRYRQRQLGCRLLELQGKTEELQRRLRDYFEAAPGLATLQPCWANVAATARPQLRSRVEQLADSCAPLTAIELLLHVGSDAAAAARLVADPDCIAGRYYGQLSTWAQTFEQQRQPLAAILCYRTLLTDLLERGYSPAYHHGARYFHQLLALDPQVQDYQGLIDAQGFIRRVQQQHWRKRAFWQAANYPNKAH